MKPCSELQRKQDIFVMKKYCVHVSMVTTNHALCGDTYTYITDKRTDVWSRPSCIYTQIYSPKKKFFFTFFRSNFYYATFQSGRYSVFIKDLKFIFDPKKVKKSGPQKLLIIGPKPSISQSSPDHSQQPRIEFSYNEISVPDICSLICG